MFAATFAMPENVTLEGGAEASLVFKLEKLLPGNTFWTEEQSRRNFEVVSQLVTPSDVNSSPLLMHPLAHEAGGDPFHSGGRQFRSKDDPDWQTLDQWAHGKETAQQQAAPEIHYQALPNFLKLPPHIYMGEVSGVAVNSKGHIFTFSRGDHPLLEFDQNGHFVQTIGDGFYGLVFAHGVRIDAEDNIWVVDEGSNMVIKFNPEGQVLMTLGRRSEPFPGSAGYISYLPGAPPPVLSDEFFYRPTDVAFDSAGDIFITDGYGNSRVVKYDKNGKFVKTWGKKGTGPGEFQTPHSIVVDSKGLLYVADRGNKRTQIFDSDGNFLREWTHTGSPWAYCITGPSDDQVIYMADGWADRISKVDLNGKILGSFGETGRGAGQFYHAHNIACGPRNELYVADSSNYRVQKLIPPAAH